MRLVTIFAFLILAGCAPTGDKFSADSHARVARNASQIIVYRKPLFVGDGTSMLLRVDGENACKIPVNGFHAVGLKPGKHTLELRQTGMRIAYKTVAPKPGQRLYYRVDLNKAKFTTSMVPVFGIGLTLSTGKSENEKDHFNFLTEMPEEAALQELSDVGQALDCNADKKSDQR